MFVLMLGLAPSYVFAAPAFPIRVAADGRHLEDSNGAPFAIQAFASWSLFTQIRVEEIESYLENRRQKGFNTIIANLLSHLFTDNAPRNFYGAAPFTTAGDFSTPNDAYFAHIDRALDIALQKGFLVLLTPSYFGAGGGDQGWWQEIIANGPTRCHNFGRYVGTRYRTRPNVVWLLGGDYSPGSGTGLTNAVEMAKGIQATDRPDRLYTYHGSRGSTSMDHDAFRPFINLNAVYTGPDDVYQSCLNAFNRLAMPTFLIEAWYENEHGMSPYALRRQAYWATTFCTAGQTIGNAPIWYFGAKAGVGFADNQAVTWQAALEWPGSQDQQRLISLINQTNAYGLVHDNHQVITGGYGNFGENAYVTTAMKPDRSLAVSYLPGQSTLTVNLAWFAGPVTLSWYDPTNGNFSTIPGSPFANSGSRSVASPGSNSAGAGDWVLLARASNLSPPAAPQNVRIIRQ